ncbi:hypothetical protein [Bacillus sp. B1-b2]|nr:hypothetical protein [Bacillus sp. B1-b2]
MIRDKKKENVKAIKLYQNVTQILFTAYNEHVKKNFVLYNERLQKK